jgi:hypothetical protein
MVISCSESSSWAERCTLSAGRSTGWPTMRCTTWPRVVITAAHSQKNSSKTEIKTGIFAFLTLLILFHTLLLPLFCYNSFYSPLYTTRKPMTNSVEQRSSWEAKIRSGIQEIRSRVSSGSIVSDYGLDDRAIGVRFPAGAKDFSSNLCVQTGSGIHPASCTMGTGGPSPGGKARPGVTLTTHPYLVPRSWMSRSYTSSPPKRLHGV